MEQRKAKRKLAGLGAVVACPQFGLFRGEIDNLSERGMFLRTRSVYISLEAPVTVTFHPDADDPSVACSIDSVVVRQDQHGIGLRFTGMSVGDRAALLGLLKRLPVQRQAVPCDGEPLAV